MFSRRRSRTLTEGVKVPDSVVIVDTTGDDASIVDKNFIKSRLGQYKYVAPKGNS